MPSFDISLDNIATDILHADPVLKYLMQQRQNIYRQQRHSITRYQTLFCSICCYKKIFVDICVVFPQIVWNCCSATFLMLTNNPDPLIQYLKYISQNSLIPYCSFLLLPKIHKRNRHGRSIVAACSYLTELISSYPLSGSHSPLHPLSSPTSHPSCTVGDDSCKHGWGHFFGLSLGFRCGFNLLFRMPLYKYNEAVKES